MNQALEVARAAPSHSARAPLAHDELTLLEHAEVARFVAREAYDPVYGARPLKRFLSRELETPLARELLRGNLRDGAAITVVLHEGHLALRYENPEEQPADGVVEGEIVG